MIKRASTRTRYVETGSPACVPRSCLWDVSSLSSCMFVAVHHPLVSTSLLFLDPYEHRGAFYGARIP